MPKRVTNEWLAGVGRGLTSGALALAMLSGSVAGAPAARPALAEEIDCYNDKDLYDLPECVERRATDVRTGNQQNEAQGASGPSQQGAGQGSADQGNTQAQPSGGNPSQQQAGGQSQPSGGNQAQQAGGSENEGEEKPRGPVTDPWQVVLTLADAGKEATPYVSEDGNDKYGRWARTRFERDRSNSASTLGPNVIDTKVWVAKDANAARELFKEQAAIKDFPERKEGVTGPNEHAKPTKYGEEFSVASTYWQDEKVWQHYRFVIRQGNIVSVLYLFGREEFFMDTSGRSWNGQGDWYTATVFHRM